MTDKKQRQRDQNKLTDKSSDRDYFIITPRLVWAFARNPYDYTLWNVVKDIAGEHGQCILDTPQLATLAMMSDGQVSDSREYLLAVGLFLGKKYREQGFPMPVWHLTIPDLWRPNIEWSQRFRTLAARIDFKQQQKPAVKKAWDKYKSTKAGRKAKGEWEYDREVIHQVKKVVGLSLYESVDSPGEKDPTYSEKDPTPGERKKIMIDHDHMNEWMDDDPICKFLLALPGYNQANIEKDRKTIVAHHYSLEALGYLWAYAQEMSDPDRGTPIGMLLSMCANEQQAPAYLDLIDERKKEPKRKPSKEADPLLNNPAVVAYRDVMHLTPNAVQRAEIASVVGDNGHVEDWRAVLHEWLLSGYKPANVAGQLDKFKKQIGAHHEPITRYASTGNRTNQEPTPEQRAVAERINAARVAKHAQ